MRCSEGWFGRVLVPVLLQLGQPFWGVGACIWDPVATKGFANRRMEPRGTASSMCKEKFAARKGPVVRDGRQLAMTLLMTSCLGRWVVFEGSLALKPQTTCSSSAAALDPPPGGTGSEILRTPAARNGCTGRSPVLSEPPASGAAWGAAPNF